MSNNRIALGLRALRSRAGYGAREFARAVGEASSSYFTYERGTFKQPFLPINKARAWAPHLIGRGEPPITLDEVAALAGTTAEYLRVAPSPAGQDQSGDLVNDPDELAWLRLWRAMDSSERTLVLRILRSGLKPDDT